MDKEEVRKAYKVDSPMRNNRIPGRESEDYDVFNKGIINHTELITNLFSSVSDCNTTANG